MRFGREDYNRRIIDIENKIPQDEPVFLLRSSDKFAPRLLLDWAKEVRLSGGDPNIAAEAENHAQKMIEWQKLHGSKTPDVYNESESRKLIRSKLDKLVTLSDSNRLDIKSISKLFGEYFGGDGYDHIQILLKNDLKDPTSYSPMNSITLDDFTLTEEDQLNIVKKRLIVFCDISGDRILKYSLE